MELISIIVPIYKVEPYLKQCLDSIVNQTYKNLEIILVDDGSPDNCGKICDEYAKKDNRIKVIHKENGGLSSARNAGLDIMTGEYVSFIDSDDYVSCNFIEKLYFMCTENDAEIAECDFIKFQDEVYIESQNVILENFNASEMQERLYSCNYIRTVVVWNKLYKKKIYSDLRFPVGKINEDEFTTYKAFYKCKNNIITSSEKLYYYRYNADSIMGRTFNEKRLDVLSAYEERKEFYKLNEERSLFDKTVVFYQNVLKTDYFLTKKCIKEPKAYLKDIKQKCKNNYKEYKKIQEINSKEKGDMKLFSCFPETYYNFEVMKNNIRMKKQSIKDYIKYELYKIKYNKYKKICKKNKQKEFIIFNSPVHGNLGDHAIIYAEYKILEKYGIKPFEVSTYRERFVFDYIKKKVSDDAIISITGGGFIGSEWTEEENLVNKVIENFSKHKIIIFPQTFYFKGDYLGRKELAKSKNAFNKAKNITIFAREKFTYEFVKKNYKDVKCLLVPDIVLSLDLGKWNFERDGILVCFRKDVEKKVSNETTEEINNYIKSKKINVKYNDTCISGFVEEGNREKHLMQKFTEFAKAKLVITDRLHGMIFAAITNTPCIVFNNYNYKIKGVYDWIKSKKKNIILKEDTNLDGDFKKLLEYKESNDISFKDEFNDLYLCLEEEQYG